MKYVLKSRYILVGGSAVVAAAASLAWVLPGGTSGNLHAHAHTVKVELTSSVSQALADTTGDISYVHSTVTSKSGGVVVNTATWVAPNGSARIKTFSPGGSLLTDESISSDGAAQVIDYARHAWWTLTSSAMISAPDVQQMITDLHSGALAPDGEQVVNGTTEMVLHGSPPELPSGSTVRLLVNPTTYLPISATDHEPGATVVEQLTWSPSTAANVAQLSASVPVGFVHLSSPPSGLSSGGVG